MGRSCDGDAVSIGDNYLMARPAGAPLRAEDALFLHVATSGCPQQVGAVVVLDARIGLAGLRAAVAERSERIPRLRLRLIPAAGSWDRPRWATDAGLDAGGRIGQLTAEPGGSGESAAAMIERVAGDYFARPLDPARAPWELLLIQDRRGGPSVVAVKAHHALGDSFALISALSGLFDPPAAVPGPRAGAAQAPAKPGLAAVASPGLAAVPSVGLGGARRIAAGLAGLALAGAPAALGASGASAAPAVRRQVAVLSLDARAMAGTARRLRAGIADLVLALAAHALGQLQPQIAGGRAVRALVPYTLRTAHAGFRDGAGNRTSGLLVDLPTAPMPLQDRVAAIAAVRQARLRRGDADAAAFVLRAMNLLPQPAQRAVARTAFTSRRFSLIASIFPGTRRPRHLVGARVTTVYPVLALADGVGLALGAMTWGASLSIGIIADPDRVPDARLIADGIRNAFAGALSQGAPHQCQRKRQPATAQPTAVQARSTSRSVADACATGV